MRGVIYAHAGKACLARLIVSLHSLRKHWNGPVTVFQEDTAEPELNAVCKELDVTITEYEGKGYNNYTKKCHANLLTEYDVNMYLDADTLVVGPLDEFFELVEKHDLVFVNFSNWTPKGNIIGGRIRRWEKLYPEATATALNYPVALNTGSYGFKKNHPFLEGWLNTSAEGGKEGIPLTDELAAQLLVQFFPHYVASIEWGYSVRFGESLMPIEKARIIHYHGRKHSGNNACQKLWRQEFEEIYKKWGMKAWDDRKVRKLLRKRDTTFKLTESADQEKEEKAKAESVDQEKEEKAETVWVDVLTTVVPRACVTEGVGSFSKGCERAGVKLRWIVHMDKIPELMPKYEETKAQIEAMKDEFDDFVYMESDGIGQGRALYKLFTASEHNVMLWEDDKSLSKPFSMKDVLDKKVDYLTFQRRRVGPGGTSNSYWARKVVECVLAREQDYKEEDCIEMFLKGACKHKKFSLGCIPAIAEDVGVKALADMGLERRRGNRRRGHGASKYVHTEASDITFVTAVNQAYLKKLKKNFKQWANSFYISNYPFLVFYHGVEEKELEDIWGATLIPWDVSFETDNERERMLTAFVLGAPDHVQTSHWIKIDADTNVTRGFASKPFWPAWKEYDIVGNKWGYTKVKGDPGYDGRHWLNTLDDWWISKVDPKAEPMYPEIEGRLHKHGRISSFVSCYSLEFSKKLKELCGDRMPIPSQDTLAWYVAERLDVKRKRERIRRSIGLSA
jgi:hypothetical protein